jgi:hypothetical protein
MERGSSGIGYLYPSDMVGLVRAIASILEEK